MAAELSPEDAERAAEFAERSPMDSSWDRLAADDPQLAAEAALAAAVHQVMTALGTRQIAVPADFEARLMARLREDKTLLDLLNVGVTGFSHALLDLLNIVFGLLPASAPAPVAAS